MRGAEMWSFRGYPRLFLSLLPLAALNALLVALVVATKAGRLIWLVAIPALLGSRLVWKWDAGLY